jgi:Chaperone of endosialidase
MSCGCNSGYDNGIYGNVCDADTPYPSISHESVPSLIDNLVYALYGTINKSVTSGKVVWNIPCDPNQTAQITNVPRYDGEGLLCYIIRGLNYAINYAYPVTLSGVQTLSGKTLVSPTITGGASVTTGSVGIGTSSPTQLLDVIGNQANAGVTARVYNSNTGSTSASSFTAQNGSGVNVSLQTYGTTSLVNCSSNHSLTLRTNNTDRVFISNTGNVGVGTSSPTQKLDIVGLVRSRIVSGTGAGVYCDSIANNNRFFLGSDSVSEAFRLYDATAGQQRVYVDANGNIGIGNSAPTQKLDVTGAIKATQAVYSNDGTTLSRMQSSGGVSYLGTTSNHPVVIQTNNTEKVRIDASGAVKITNGGFYTDPTLIIQGNTLDGFASINLQSSSGTNPASVYQDGTNGSLGIKTTQSGSGTYFLNAAGQTNATFFESGRLIIPKNKGIDIGDITNTSSTTSLQIFGYGSTRGYGIYMRPSTDAANCVPIQFTNAAGSLVGGLVTTASTTSLATSSDYRLKTNVVPLENALARVSDLPVHQFNWAIDTNGQRVDGFLAHEAQAVVPESVFGTKDAVDSEGKPVYQSIDQSKLVPLLTAAIKELKTIVETQEQRIQALEAKANTPTA